LSLPHRGPSERNAPLLRAAMATRDAAASARARGQARGSREAAEKAGAGFYDLEDLREMASDPRVVGERARVRALTPRVPREPTRCAAFACRYRVLRSRSAASKSKLREPAVAQQSLAPRRLQLPSSWLRRRCFARATLCADRRARSHQEAGAKFSACRRSWWTLRCSRRA
jgi:hypothetical protein